MHRERARPVRAQGIRGLDALPGVGPGIAAAIAEMLQTGRWVQLERLRGTLDPALLFQTVPGIGPELAQRIHDALNVETLEALEAAAHDGRLETVHGVGARRTATIRAALAEILDRSRLRHAAPCGRRPASLRSRCCSTSTASTATTRARGACPRSRRAASIRSSDAWLPVLHTVRGNWHFTALFSNTAKAHELGRTHDWVVLYFHDDDRAESQRTVVTETHGTLVGRRVVRGREDECRAHYEHGARPRASGDRWRPRHAEPAPDAAATLTAIIDSEGMAPQGLEGRRSTR